ncbi:MAG: rod shape-determining protein MreD [Acidimicrobiales bacterium]
MSAPWARTVFKVALLLALGILLQTTFGDDLRVDDVAPDLLVLLAVCAGFVGGPDTGAVVGFGAGLVSDLFLQSTPFGLSALAACLAGFVVGWAGTEVLRSRMFMVPLVAAGGTVLGVVLFVVLGYLVGQSQLLAGGSHWLAGVALVEACYAALFSLPAFVLMRWALAGPAVAPGALSAATPGGTATGDLSSRRHASVRARRRRRARAGVR